MAGSNDDKYKAAITTALIGLIGFGLKHSDNIVKSVKSIFVKKPIEEG